MFVAAFFGSLGVPGDVKNFLVDDFAATVENLHRIVADNGKFAVVQNVNFPRVIDYRGNVRRNEIFAFAQTDNERIVLLRAD